MQSHAIVRVLTPVLLAVAAVEAGETVRFRPEIHTEPGTLARFSVADAARLKETLRDTGVGRMLESPAWRKLWKNAWTYADGPLTRIDRLSKEWTGRSLYDVLHLIRGEVVLDLDVPAESSSADRGPSRHGRIPWVLAIELRGTRREILQLASRAMSVLEDRTGAASSRSSVAGTDLIVWTHPKASFHHAVMGTHLLVSSSQVRIEASVRAYAASIEEQKRGPPAVDCTLEETGEAEIEEIAPGESSREASWIASPAAVRVARPEVLARIRLRPLFDWLVGIFTTVERRDMNSLARASGIDALETLWFSLGGLEGGVETAWRVTSRGGARGLVDVIRSGWGKLESVASVLALLPPSARRVQGMRLRPGRFLRGLDLYVRRSVPELGMQLDEVYHDIETLTGIHVPGDLFELGGLSAYTVSLSPPADRFTRDHIVLIRTKELRPYRRVFERMVSRLGLQWRLVPPRSSAAGSDSAVHYVYLNSIGLRESGEGDPKPFSTDSAPLEWCSTVAAALLPALARLSCSVDQNDSDHREGWTALSTSPQSLVRFRDFYSKEALLARDETFAAFVLQALEGSSAAVAFRGTETLSWLHDSMLRGMKPLTSVLARAGVDLAVLPSVETFLGEALPGHARLEWSSSGITIQTRRVLPSVVVTALVAATTFAAPVSKDE